jgi:hypothetical protein
MNFENNRRLARRLLFFLLFAANLLRANGVLERPIIVGFNQTSLKTALDEVARLGGFEWSYNARILDEKRLVNLPTASRTIRETLVLLLGDDYTFKQSGNYLILKKNKKPQQKLSGYISDPHTGKKMSNVTVYDRQTLRSTTTDSSGFYELPVSPKSEIVISKLDYRDTVLQVTSQTPRFVKLELYADSLPQKNRPSFRQQVNRASYFLEDFFVKTSQELAALNVEDSLHRRFQLSFVPGIGTNLRLSGNVVNDFSVNILAGYSRGNRILEVAGLGNITREDMTGVQAAGVFNNLRGNAGGLQAGGIYNFVGDTLSGVQVGGIANVGGYGRSPVQVAGISNHLRRANGGIQIAGLTNDIGSGQAGLQIAGLVNVTDTLQGTQIAGLFNRARHLRGVQIGLINVAKENDGVQVGLLNFSNRGGYVALEASANDVLWANLSIKTGVPAFHVILTAGLDSFAINEQSLWAFGGGIGTRARLAPWCGLHFDLVHRHVSEGYFDDEVQEWEQFALGLDLRVAGGLHLTGGPTFNLFVADPAEPESSHIRSRVVGKNVLPADAGDGWLSGWWGWTAGVKWRF